MLDKAKVFLRSVVEDFRAHRRGEHRIAPRGTRGRVYAPKGAAAPLNTATSGNSFRIGKTPTAHLTMTITRADGTKEIVRAPAQVTSNG